MQNPFAGKPQQAISPALKEDPALGKLAAQVL